MGCVLIPEKPTEGIPPVPDKFYCEICRLSRADPYVKFLSSFSYLLSLGGIACLNVLS